MSLRYYWRMWRMRRGHAALLLSIREREIALGIDVPQPFADILKTYVRPYEPLSSSPWEAVARRDQEELKHYAQCDARPEAAEEPCPCLLTSSR